ncbi:FAD-dependent oxidoreductase [Streptomyces sp. NPDC004752]
MGGSEGQRVRSAGRPRERPGLRDEAIAAGAELTFGHKAVLSGTHTRKDAPVTVRVGHEECKAEKVLVCAGAWSTELPDWARIPGLRVQPAYMQVATFSGGLSAPNEDAFYLIHDEADRFCAIPLGSGPGSRLQFGHFSLPAAVHRMNAAELARVTWLRDIGTLRRHMPGLGEVTEWVTIPASYTMPPDGSFVLRWVSPRIATLVACSGVGFKFAPAIAGRVAAAFEGHVVPNGVRVEHPA